MPAVTTPDQQTSTDFSGLETSSLSLDMPAARGLLAINEMLREYSQRFRSREGYVDAIPVNPSSRQSLSDMLYRKDGRLVFEHDPASYANPLDGVEPLQSMMLFSDPVTYLQSMLLLNQIVRSHNTEGNPHNIDSAIESFISKAAVTDKFPEITRALGFNMPADALPLFTDIQGTLASLSSKDVFSPYVTGYQRFVRGADGQGSFERGQWFPDGSVLEVGRDGQVAQMSRSNYEWTEAAWYASVPGTGAGLSRHDRHLAIIAAVEYLEKTLNLPSGTMPVDIQQVYSVSENGVRRATGEWELKSYRNSDGQVVTLDSPVKLELPKVSKQETLQNALAAMGSTGLNNPDKAAKMDEYKRQIALQNYIENDLGYPKGSTPQGHFNWEDGTYTLRAVIKPGEEKGQFRDRMVGGTGGIKIKLDV